MIEYVKERYRERKWVGEFVLSELHRLNGQRECSLLGVEPVARVFSCNHLKFPKGWGEEEIGRA